MIANEVMRIVSTSFRLTIGLNTGILLAAALGVLSPLATSVLHNGSTIAILLNVLSQRIDARRRRCETAISGRHGDRLLAER